MLFILQNKEELELYILKNNGTDTIIKVRRYDSYLYNQLNFANNEWNIIVMNIIKKVSFFNKILYDFL